MPTNIGNVHKCKQDPKNKFDSKAIAVYSSQGEGQQIIGHIPLSPILLEYGNVEDFLVDRVTEPKLPHTLMHQPRQGTVCVCLCVCLDK